MNWSVLLRTIEQAAVVPDNKPAGSHADGADQDDSLPTAEADTPEDAVTSATVPGPGSVSEVVTPGAPGA